MDYDLPTQYLLGGAVGGAAVCYSNGAPVALSQEMAMCAGMGAVGAYAVKMANDQFNLFPKLQTSGVQASASYQQMLYRMLYGAIPGAVVVGVYRMYR